MSGPDHVQTIVVGAGVIGLAIARRLARAGQEVLILEAESAFGQHTSSRNSGVIHAGIYYPRHSPQARLCRTGRDMLYDFCATRHVGHARCGKLTLAPDAARIPELHDLLRRGAENDLDDLYVISGEELAEREPAARGAGAMVSPSSGIVDPVGLMRALLGEAESAGAVLALNAPLRRVEPTATGLRVEVGDAASTRLACTSLVNAAGLGAWDVARSVKGIDQGSIPAKFLAKGSYFSISGASPFSALVYPMPLAGSLGIHSVQDIGGGVRFGPNMEWVDKVDYTVDPALLPSFESAIRRYWPGLEQGALGPDMAGVRPRIWGPGEKKRGFLFSQPADSGIKGLVSLFGFESPGLTACLAIARQVERLVARAHG